MLQDAIQLIRQGRKLEARGMLERLLRANPTDVSAWFWYAETLETIEKRVKVLELCLKANPGNAQAEKALSALQLRLSAASAPPAPVTPAFDFDAKPAALPDQVSGVSAFDWGDEPAAESSRPSYGLQWEDEPEQAPASSIDWDSIEQQQAPAAQEGTYEPSPDSATQAPEKPRRHYSLLNVWFTALTSNNERDYQALLLDPEATQGRAYEWMAYIGLISGLMLPVFFLTSGVLDQPESQALVGTVDQTMLLVILGGAGAILSCIFSVLGLMIHGGVQFLIAKALGGDGTYSRTVYALGAYLAPMTLISMIIGAIPLVNCLAIVVSIYALVLNVRALKAAHYMDTSRAVMVIFLPGILLLIVFCLVGVFAAPALGEVLSTMP